MISECASVASIALTVFLVNARHLVYGLSYPLHSVKGLWAKALAIHTLCDEAFALNSGPDRNERSGARILWVNTLIYVSWILSVVLGYVLGASFLNDLKGVDFVMVAIFTVLAMDGYRANPDRVTALFVAVSAAIALIFVSLPFTVRAIQPVLANLDPSYEEAAQILGASRLTTLRKVIIPVVLPALIGGAGMGFARSLGEYGSVIFIAGNVPLVSEIAPLIIMSKLDLYDVQGASVVALLMLAISFLLILFINLAQWSVAKRISPIR